MPVVPVSVAPVSVKAIPTELDEIGTVQAFSTVNVKSMVQGQIVKVGFKQGDFVTRGQMLFQIDPRPYQAALDQAQANLQQAQANLAKDQANLATDKVQADRYTKLTQAGVVSREQFDQVQTAYQAALASVNADKAAIQADEAAVEDAKIQLGYCVIRSPMAGRTGSLQIYQGNLVKANDVAIVSINQVQPIYVQFSVPEQYLEQIRSYMAQHALKVQATVAGVPRPEEGTLTFVDNTVDTNTGTIALKASFANPDRKLWPGQFVNVHLQLSVQSNAVVVPSPAVQTGQNGQYVYVVKQDQTVTMQPVQAGTTYGSDTVITKGLKPGETVVTDGQLMLLPGAKIKVKPAITPVQEGQEGQS
jgi:multidrug efflux system membrane fusion protein